MEDSIKKRVIFIKLRTDSGLIIDITKNNFLEFDIELGKEVKCKCITFEVFTRCSYKTDNRLHRGSYYHDVIRKLRRIVEKIKTQIRKGAVRIWTTKKYYEKKIYEKKYC